VVRYVLVLGGITVNPKEFLAVANKQLNLTPGMGLGTKAWNPMSGIERMRKKKAAEGVSANERMRLFQEAGVKDYEGMRRVFERAYVSPEKAFMLVRGR
jgi:hypothetical protein